MRMKIVSVLAMALAAVTSAFADYSRMDFMTCQAQGTSGNNCTWVMTDYTPASTDRIEMKLRSTNFSATQCLFCSRNGSMNNTVTTFIIGGTTIRYDRANNTQANSPKTLSQAADAGVDHVIVYDGKDGKGYVDNANAVNLNSASASYTGGSTMSLFASQTGGSLSTLGNFAYYRFYYCRVYNKDGKLVRNFVPARDNSKAAGASTQCGVWDTVTGTFFANKGTKAFDLTGATVVGTLGAAPSPMREIVVSARGVSGSSSTATLEFRNPGFAQLFFVAWNATMMGGETTNEWEHVEQQADVLASETTRVVTLPAAARYARFFLKPILPNGLTAVEYLRSTGTDEYVNTGFTPTSASRADYHLTLANGKNVEFMAPFGSRKANELQFFVGSAAKANYWFRRYGTQCNDANFVGKPDWGGEHFISLDHNQFTLDSYVTQMTRADFTCVGPAYIFAVNNNGVASQFADMKLHSLSIWDDGALVRNYVPCLNASGTAALYETVSGQLVYGAAGTTPLTAGGESWSKSPLCVADLSIAMKAVWTGAGDGATAADAANWDCTNVAGLPITGGFTEQVTDLFVAGNVALTCPERLPHKTVAFGPITLTADCDWRGLGTLNLTSRVDVAGHTLRVADLSGVNGEITDATGWTELDSLESLGEQHLVTDLKPECTDRIETEVYFKAFNGNQALWCARGADTTRDTLTAFMIGATARFDRNFDTVTSATNNPVLKQWTTIVADYQTKRVTINGVLSQLMADGDYEPASKLCLFASHAGGETAGLNNWANYFMRSFKVYAADGTLKLDFVARMRNSDSVSGFYDRVSGTFYPASNGKNFRMGNVISTDATGTLIVDVPDQVATTNSTTGVKLNGGLAVVKDGPGTWIQLPEWNSFTRGLRIAAGRMELNSSVTSEYNRLMGGYNTLIEVDQNAILDNRCVYDIGTYHPMILAGTLENTAADMRSDYGNYLRMTLTGNAKVDALFNSCIGGGGGIGLVDLAGHTLELKAAAGKSVFVSSCQGTVLTNGTVRMVEGGTCAFAFPCEMRTVDLEMVGGALNVAAETQVRNYRSATTGGSNAGSAALNVYGTFAPLTDFFYGCTLQDGATLDLSQRTTELPATSASTAGRRVVDYAPGARITVNLGTRTLSPGTRLVAWSTKPEATFVWADPACTEVCAVGADGLYYGANPDSTEIDHAIWTGAAGDGDLRNPANWRCENLAGRALEGRLPDSTSTLRLGADTVFNFASAQWLQLVDNPADSENKSATVCSRIGTVLSGANGGDAPFAFLDYSADDFIYLGAMPLTQLRNSTWSAANLPNACLRFDGWFKVNTEQSGTWTLRTQADDYVGVAFDGTWVASNGVWSASATSTCEVEAGWHRFTVVIGDGGGGYGSQVKVGGQTTVMGVAINGGAEVAFEDAFTFGSGEVISWRNIDVKDCTLAGDCDWRALNLPLETLLDLNGHSLRVNGLSNAKGTITNSNETALGTLRVAVPARATVSGLNVTLTGNAKLEKEGAGTFTVVTANQSYKGGTEVKEGTLKVGAANIFGAAGSLVRVLPDGLLDVAGKTGFENYALELAGGRVTSSADGATTGNGFREVTLTADSSVPSTGNFLLVGGNVPGRLDLGGHKLSATVASGKYLYISQTQMTNGVLEGVSGGYLAFDRAPVDAATVDIDINIAMRQLVPFKVRNYTARYSSNWSMSAAGVAVQVGGTFLPLGTHFDNVELLDGAVLDLSSQTNTWSATSANTYSGAHYCRFHNGSHVTVDCHGRTLVPGEKLVSWNAQPMGALFTLDAASAAALGSADLTAAPDGIYVGGTLTWKGGDGDLGTLANWQTAAGEDATSLDGMTLTVNGAVNLTAPQKLRLVATTLKVNGTATLTEPGGLCFGGLDVGAAARLVVDPVAFTIRLLGAPSFASGAKLALAPKYAASTKGRFLVMTWDYGTLDEAAIANLFDTSSTAAGAAARLSVETVGEGGRLWLELAPNTVKPRLNVLVLGDGFAVGRDDKGNFRIPFVKELEADGYEVITKGFRTIRGVDLSDATMPAEWCRHAADSNMSIATGTYGAGFLESIANILEQAGDVDFVVTLVGANDLYNQRTPEATYASWCELVARIRAQKPHAKIIALNLPDRPDISNEEEFNARFAADVAHGTFGAKCLYPVDLYSLLPREDENFWRGTDVGAPERAGMAKLAAALAATARTALADDPAWETGAVEPLVTTTGVEANVPAAERSGFTRACVFDIAANNVGKAIGSSVPYEFDEGVIDEIGRVAWYLELKRPNGSVRWIWAACDAWGQKNIYQVGIPVRLVSQNAVSRLRVKTNMPGIAETADGVYDCGAVEFWPTTYSGAAKANNGMPGEAWADDWNDTPSTDLNSAYGSMQLHRFTPQGPNAGEVLFAFNRWKTDAAWELGLGNFACMSVGTLDWTFTTSTEKGADIVESMGSKAYEIARLEIWTMPAEACAGQIASALWTNGAGDGDVTNPANWSCTNNLGQAVANALPDSGTQVRIENVGSITIPRGVVYGGISLGDCTLEADVDLRGHGPVQVEGTIVLNGHRLYLEQLVGGGHVTETQVYDLTTTDVTKASSPTTFLGGTAANLFNNNTVRAGTDNTKRVIVEKKNLPMIVDYNFGTPTTIDSYRVWFGPLELPKRGPKTWTVEGSNDGTTWTVVDTRDNIFWQNKNYGVIFSLAEPVTYSRFRFKVTDSLADSSDPYMEFVQLEYGREALFGELHIDVPEGVIAQNDTVLVDGQVRLIKEGKGTLVMARTDQYYWSSTVRDGLVKLVSGVRGPIGRYGAAITIEPEATFDMAGDCYETYYYTFNLDGGTLKNSVGVPSNWTKAMIQNVHLGADSTIDFVDYGFIAASYVATSLDLNGHVLTAKGTSGNNYFATTYATPGTVKLSGSWEVYKDSPVSAPETRFEVYGQIHLNAATTFGEYIDNTSATVMSYNAVLTVMKRFMPNTDYFRGCTLSDGVVIDLSGRTTAWNLDSKIGTTTQKTVTFATGGHYMIDVKGRALKNGERLLVWNQDRKPSNFDSLILTLDSATRKAGYRLEQDDDGILIVRDATFIFLR